VVVDGKSFGLEEADPLVREVPTSDDETPVRHPAELTPNDQERSLLGQLGDISLGIEDLIVRTGLIASQVQATLSVLELRRLVRSLRGHQFVRA
jgi:DNA processing protein